VQVVGVHAQAEIGEVEAVLLEFADGPDGVRNRLFARSRVAAVRW
jgi:hypothetical protein